MKAAVPQKRPARGPAAGITSPKKRSKKRKDQQRSKSRDLSEDALGLVMEFLAPRELFRMAFTCKILHAKVTTSLVIRSAMVHGGHAGTSIEELYKLMKTKSIHIPSTMRLLRVVNGKRCESCNINKVNFIRSGFGVFLCTRCLTTESEYGPPYVTQCNEPWVENQLHSPNSRLREIIFHPRVVWLNRANVWARRLELNSGEICGPLIAVTDIARLATGTEPVSTMLNDLPPEKDYEEFIKTFENYQDNAKAAKVYRNEKKTTTREQSAERRKARALEVVAEIRNRLDDPWKDFALEHRETGILRKGPCLEFKAPFCNELLKECVTTPSKAKKAVIKHKGHEINQRFRALKDLLNFSFLSDEHPFEEALKRYCREQFPDIKSVVLHPNADRVFFERIDQNRPFDAIELLVVHFSVVIPPRDSAMSQNDRALAKNVWQHELSKRLGICARVLFRENYIASFLALDEIKAAATEFISWLKTRSGYKYLAHCSFIENRVYRDQNLLPFLYRKDFFGLINYIDGTLWGLSDSDEG